MSTDKLITEKDGAIGWVTFNNPARHNAMTLGMWQGVEAALADFGRDDAIRAVVFKGAGEKAFVAGADISEFENERSSEEGVRRYGEAVESAYDAIYNCPKPTIAMIQGYCVGGGVGLAICTDLRICADNAVFAIPAAKLGLGYTFPNLRKLVQLVGPSFAKEIFYTARRFDGQEALGMGLVNRMVPLSELQSYVRDYAERIAGNAPLTVESVGFIVNEIMRDPAERDLEACAAKVKTCFDSQDYVEGRQAFMEKRKPAFVGR